MKSMKDQYGSKRGEQVFYASMNKGTIKGVEKMQKGGLGVKSGPPPKKGPSSQGVTLKSGIKVLKARGGADASLSDFKPPAQKYTPGPGDTGGAGGAINTNTGGNQNFSTTMKNVGTTAKNIGMSTVPFTPAGMAIEGLKAIENARRAKRAKGEFFLSKKKELPITRDFYKTKGRPLDTKIGSMDEPYMKEAGIIGFKKTKFEDNAGPKTVMCPDGSFPPCVDTTKAKGDASPFKFNFKYRDGGMVRGSGKVLKGKIKKARIY